VGKYYVYILSNRLKQLYIGQTNNLSVRLSQHNDTKRSGWASKRGPWEVVGIKDFKSCSLAMREEKNLKSLKNKNILSGYIAGWRSSISGGS